MEELQQQYPRHKQADGMFRLAAGVLILLCILSLFFLFAWKPLLRGI